ATVAPAIRVWKRASAPPGGSETSRPSRSVHTVTALPAPASASARARPVRSVPAGAFQRTFVHTRVSPLSGAGAGRARAASSVSTARTSWLDARRSASESSTAPAAARAPNPPRTSPRTSVVSSSHASITSLRRRSGFRLQRQNHTLRGHSPRVLAMGRHLLARSRTPRGAGRPKAVAPRARRCHLFQSGPPDRRAHGADGPGPVARTARPGPRRPTPTSGRRGSGRHGPRDAAVQEVAELLEVLAEPHGTAGGHGVEGADRGEPFQSRGQGGQRDGGCHARPGHRAERG